METYLIFNIDKLDQIFMCPISKSLQLITFQLKNDTKNLFMKWICVSFNTYFSAQNVQWPIGIIVQNMHRHKMWKIK